MQTMGATPKIKKRIEPLGKVEIISAFVYICTGYLLYTLAGQGISAIALSLLLIVFTILLIVYVRQHVYWDEKPWLAVFSIFCKTLVYVAFIFNMCKYPGRDILTIMPTILLVIYAVLAYIHGKQYSQMLNAYAYLCMISFARIGLFLS
jgi:hypothetical protein